MTDSEGSRRTRFLSEEVAAISAGRRRLGYLVIAAAVLLGTSVLLALFFSSLYMSNPSAVQASFIEAISERAQAQLDPDARDRAERLREAFDTLDSANEAGALGWRDLAAVWMAYAERGADGVLDPEEADELIERIEALVDRAASPRRL
jgi:hypothetical protein